MWKRGSTEYFLDALYLIQRGCILNTSMGHCWKVLSIVLYNCALSVKWILSLPLSVKCREWFLCPAGVTSSECSLDEMVVQVVEKRMIECCVISIGPDWKKYCGLSKLVMSVKWLVTQLTIVSDSGDRPAFFGLRLNLLTWIYLRWCVRQLDILRHTVFVQLPLVP